MKCHDKANQNAPFLRWNSCLSDELCSTPSSIPLLTYQCFLLDVLCRVEVTLKFSLDVFT